MFLLIPSYTPPQASLMFLARNSFTSHIHMTLSPLLLLYLYLTPKNWHSGTRTALSTPLPFPIRYIIPPQLRTLARSRTTHLGFSSLDLTAAAEEDERKAEKEAGLPEGNNVSSSLRNALKNRRTPASAVRRDTALQIKVHALIDTALESLTDLLSRNDNKSSFFLDAEEEITSFDCLALGYLSLALIPQMESDWLQKGMLTKYPTLCTFINQGVKRCFGGVSTSSPTPTGSESPLPWSTPTTPSLLQTTFILLRNTLSDEPLLSQLSQRLSPSPQILASKTTPARSIPSTSLIPIIFRSTAFIGLSWIGGSILWPEWFKMNLRGMIFELAGEELRIEGGSRREKEREGEGGLGEAENLLGSLWREN